MVLVVVLVLVAVRSVPSIAAALRPRGSNLCFHRHIPRTSLRWYSRASEPLATREEVMNTSPGDDRVAGSFSLTPQPL